MVNVLRTAIEGGNKSSYIKRRIFTYHIENGNFTITELTKELDLSVPTVAKLVEEMCNAGFLQAVGKLETNGGRHPLLYGLVSDSAYFVGVDVKHFSMSIGIIDMNGNMVDQWCDIRHKFENSPEGLDVVCEKITSFINSLSIDKEKILNINVNLSGRVNPESGYSYTFFNFGEAPLTELMSQKLGYSVSVDNDSRAMTYGEFVEGAVKNEKNVLYINVSWGLGLGIIIDGKVYSGKSGFAGEFGHIPCFDNEVMCHCGKKGCLETEASGSAIHRKLLERLKNGENSILLASHNDDLEGIELSDILDAVNREDVLCIDLVEEVGYNLGKNIAGLINIFNPEMVVVGGVLSAAGDYLLQPIRTAVRKHSLNMVNKDTKIVVSKLGANAGLIGACMLSRANVFKD